MLEVAGAGFARRGRPVFQGVGFALAVGQVLCVLGPNGIGKTTLLRCIAGLETLGTGVVRLDGTALAGLTRRRIGQLVGLVPQSDAPGFRYSVREMVQMGRAAHLGWMSAPGAADRALAEAALARLGIAHLVDRAYPELSGGERQLVLIARALTQQPRLLILDEPTAHLDFARQAAVLELVRELAHDGLAVVLTTHDPDHAFAIADSVLLMAPGQPATVGAPDAVLTEAGLGRAYGRAVRVRVVEGRRVCLT